MEGDLRNYFVGFNVLRKFSEYDFEQVAHVFERYKCEDNLSKWFNENYFHR